MPNYLSKIDACEFYQQSILNGGLSAEQIAQIITFRQFGNQQGFMHISGLNIGEIPPTPTERENIVKKDYHSEMLLLQAAALLGDPIAYLQESYGQIINNFFPIPKYAHAPTSDSYDTELELHTENAFHPVHPDYMLLLCLRSDPAGDAITYISSIDNMLSHLTNEEQTYFRHERYNFLSDYAETTKGHRINLNNWLPVIYGEFYDPQLRLDIDFNEANNPEAQTALRKLNDIAWKVAKPVKLMAGDMLVINNRKTAHARSAFHAVHDGKDRWLQRTFSVNNLHQYQTQMNEQRIVKLL